MIRRREFCTSLAILILVATSGCGSRSSAAQAPASDQPILVVTIPTGTPTEPFVVPTDEPLTPTPPYNDFETFPAGDFKNSADITNEWLPLTPGTEFVYEGQTEDNGGLVTHRLVVDVTDLTKVINGVRSAVTLDQDFKANQMVETELAFYAQDSHGNIWRMGEHPEEYQNGQYVEAPTWFAGVNGSYAGIEMLGNPHVGAPSYSQGWAPSVEFTDRGQVFQVGEAVCVPADCYKDVLVIDETSQSEPGAHQLKLFVKGVGNVKVDWRDADQTQEILELVQVTRLSAEQLAAVRQRALDEEQHAYQVSKDVYGQTPPSQ